MPVRNRMCPQQGRGISTLIMEISHICCPVWPKSPHHTYANAIQKSIYFYLPIFFFTLSITIERMRLQF